MRPSSLSSQRHLRGRVLQIPTQKIRIPLAEHPLGQLAARRGVRERYSALARALDGIASPPTRSDSRSTKNPAVSV